MSLGLILSCINLNKRNNSTISGFSESSIDILINLLLYMYIKIDKSTLGISKSLHFNLNRVKRKEIMQKGNSYLDICLSGVISPIRS